MSAYKFVDVRSEQDFEREHMTKPPRTCFNVPYTQQSRPQFAAQVAAKLPKSACLLVACSDGSEGSQQAAELLAAEGYADVLQVEGGYEAWTRVFSTGGRRRPPPGQWVSTGTEALKSGLTLGRGVAASYDEGGNLSAARYAGKGAVAAAAAAAEKSNAGKSDASQAVPPAV